LRYLRRDIPENVWHAARGPTLRRGPHGGAPVVLKL
jgi:hypothetical protein